jgi:phosphoribosyl-ATP pyrophosphohydrolase
MSYDPKDPSMGDGTLKRLAATIKARRGEHESKSYTRQLLDSGPERCARKFGEEAIETVIAALGSDPKALNSEAADVLYHLLVLLEVRGVPLADVMSELDRRMGISGIDERASRPKGAS